MSNIEAEYTIFEIPKLLSIKDQSSFQNTTVFQLLSSWLEGC